MSAAIKLSSPATRGFWEIPVLFEDEHLLALDKPAGLLASPDSLDPNLPNLIGLLRAAIAVGKPWAHSRNLNFLGAAHRLDGEAGGVILLAKNKPVLASLADAFGAEKPFLKFIALVRGTPAEDTFEVNARLAPHPASPGLICVDPTGGKKARTAFETLEKFSGWTLLRCLPLTGRAHQIRVHLRHADLPVVGDAFYGGKPLWLSRLKRDFRLKPGREERPLISRPALHAEELTLPHPVSGGMLKITAPWPKDLKVAVKYLRQFALDNIGGQSAPQTR